MSKYGLRSLLAASSLKMQYITKWIGSGKVLLMCFLLVARAHIFSGFKGLLLFIEVQLGGWKQTLYITAFFFSVVAFLLLCFFAYVVVSVGARVLLNGTAAVFPKTERH